MAIVKTKFQENYNTFMHTKKLKNVHVLMIKVPDILVNLICRKILTFSRGDSSPWQLSWGAERVM